LFEATSVHPQPTLLHAAQSSPQVEVITPEDHMGDVIGDLNSRRGLINKFEDKPGKMKLVSVSVRSRNYCAFL